ncbi:putative lipase atg15 [Thecaphora frezii]
MPGCGPRIRRPFASLYLLCCLALAASIAVGTGARAAAVFNPPNWLDATTQQPWSLTNRLQRYFSATLAPLWSNDPPTSEARPGYQYKYFGLRQAYHQGMVDYPGLRATVDFDYRVHALSPLTDTANPHYIPPIRTVRQTVTRPRDAKRYLEVRGTSYEQAICAASTELDWEDVEIDAPDTSDRQTILAFAKMAALAYQNDTTGWESAGGFNLSDSFGWEGDGMRGHIFSTQDNSTIVVALKGTSSALLPGGGETARRDRVNDNMLFSCCCARVSWSWTPVCDCYAGHGDTCGQSCLERALVEKSLYYPAATDLYNNISYMYPDSQIWISGHSLGGAVSALLGITFGAPTITFEAPGDRMAALRLHLPLPPSKHPDDSPVSALPITHVYNTADSIAMGQCNGAGSFCSNLGYAMESKCHTGKTILYDTVGKLGWSSSLTTHRINTLIDSVLDEDWSEKVKKARAKGGLVLQAERGERGGARTIGWRWPWRGGQGDGDEDEGQRDEDDTRAVPRRRSEDDCRDCSSWHFIDDTAKRSE